jgi:hypothetical protein
VGGGEELVTGERTRGSVTFERLGRRRGKEGKRRGEQGGPAVGVPHSAGAVVGLAPTGGRRPVTPAFYKNKILSTQERIEDAYQFAVYMKNLSKTNIVYDALHDMAYYIFLKSLRSLEEFRKNPHVKIPPKSPCANFQSLGKFQNSISNSKIFFIFGPADRAAHSAFGPAGSR